MQFKVRIFLDDCMVAPSELSKLKISNPTIDKIVNDIVDRTGNVDKQKSIDTEVAYPA